MASKLPPHPVGNRPRQRSQRSRRSDEPVAGLAPATGGADEDSQFVGAVARAVAVLNAFRPGDGPLGNAELAERTGLPKPTVSRLTFTLQHCGYLAYDPRHRVYELGTGALALGVLAMSAAHLRRIARPLMQELARSANFNVGLGTRDGQQMVYTDACEGEALIGLRLYAGSRIPVLTTSMGRAWLAGHGPEEAERLIAELRPLHDGAGWKALIAAVGKARREVAAHGYCVSVGDWQRDIHGAAAPIRHPVNGRVFAINLGGPAYSLPEKLLHDDLGPRIARTAAAIERALDPPDLPPR